MAIVKGPPVFAAHVRSGSDDVPAANAIAAKRDESFEAGTDIVWNVDRQGGSHPYSRSSPDHLKVFSRGDIARAEAVVPGWTLNVAYLYRH